jgi:uncharacterized membrane protein
MLNKVSLAIIVISLALAFAVYPFLPDTLVSHWDSSGQPNGYSNKAVAIFIFPVLSLALFFLFILIPHIDPYKHNYSAFSKYYRGFILVLTLFLFYLFILTILSNFGINFNMMHALIPAFSAMFFYLGILLENAKRNWFVGIRTPWTLSSEKVWHKTHQIGGMLFKLSAMISLIGLIFPKLAIWFILLPIGVSAVFVVIYSYFLFKRK